MHDIVQPTIDALADEGMPFTGFLYVGLMIDQEGRARVVEYNVRLGDPETQPLMMRLQSDLLPLLDHAVDGTLPEASINWHQGSAIGIVMAAGEYPAGSSQGKPITGIEAAESGDRCKVFHAGTRLEGDQLVTAGGRVLCVTATGTISGSGEAAGRSWSRLYCHGMVVGIVATSVTALCKSQSSIVPGLSQPGVLRNHACRTAL